MDPIDAEALKYLALGLLFSALIFLVILYFNDTTSFIYFQF